MKIYCCGCEVDIEATLIRGSDAYPHRSDLAKLPFWRCPTCREFVGCHHKSKTPTKPLGVIPTPEIKKRRSALHGILDPIWRSKLMSRKEVYARMTSMLGKQFHAAELRTVDEANEALKMAMIIEEIAEKQNA